MSNTVALERIKGLQDISVREPLLTAYRVTKALITPCVTT